VVVSASAIDVPDAVLPKLAALGEVGEQWLANLPDLIGDLTRRWQLQIGRVLPGGTGAYVAEAHARAGRRVILKLSIPDGLNGHGLFGDELQALLLANGRGFVRVLEYDETRRAMVQERLGKPLDELGLSTGAQIEIICRTLRRCWLPVPAETPLPTSAEKARWLATFIAETWEQLHRPCAEHVVERALAFAAARVADFEPDLAVLVHGDAHANNLLQGADGSRQFTFIDPDPMLAEPACDLAVPMRQWNAELLAGSTARLLRERCAAISRFTGIPSAPIWQWGFLERVSTGLFLSQLGDEQQGQQFLAVAALTAAP